MIAPRNQGVRLGQPTGNPLPKWVWLLAALAIAAGIMFFVSLRSTSDGGDFTEERCQTNDDCPEDRFCAAGGCIIILPDENKDMWTQDLLAQRNPEAGAPPWRPRPKYGAKLNATDNCLSTASDDGQFTQQGAVSVQQKRTIIYASTDLQIFSQVDATSNMWLNFIPLSLPRLADSDPVVYCYGREVRSVRKVESPIDVRIDVGLTQSVPAGAAARVALRVKRPLPPALPDGTVVLSFELAPVASVGGADETTVLVLPLGSDVLSLEGQTPALQRLLTGHIVYYWKHDQRRHTVTSSIRLPAYEPPNLNWNEIQP